MTAVETGVAGGVSFALTPEQRELHGLGLSRRRRVVYKRRHAVDAGDEMALSVPEAEQARRLGIEERREHHDHGALRRHGIPASSSSRDHGRPCQPHADLLEVPGSTGRAQRPPRARQVVETHPVTARDERRRHRRRRRPCRMEGSGGEARSRGEPVGGRRRQVVRLVDHEEDGRLRVGEGASHHEPVLVRRAARGGTPVDTP